MKFFKHTNIASPVSDKLSLGLAILFLFINLGLLIWYIFVGYQWWFHSDSAAQVLFAREIAVSGKLYPSDWNYVNNDLGIFSRYLFILPLLSFMPAGYTVFAISGIIYSALVLISIWWLTGVTQAGYARRIWVIAIISAGISGFMAENLFGQISYGPAVLFSSIILILLYKYLNSPDKRQSYHGTALLLILIIIFCSNPARAIVYYGIPLAGTIAWYILARENFKPSKKLYRLIVFIAAGILTGTFLHLLLSSMIISVAGAGQAHWLSYEQMTRNLSLTLKGLLATLGGLPTPDGKVLSLHGIYDALRFTSTLIVIGMIPYTFLRILKTGTDGMFLIAVYSLIMLVAVFFLQVTTSLPVMTAPIQSFRYLVPPLVLFLILVLIQPLEWWSRPFAAFFTLVIAGVLVTSGFPAYVKSDADSTLHWTLHRKSGSNAEKLIDFLLSNGLHYGYATFWNAGNISVLSSEKVLVRPVYIDRGLPVPERHLSSIRWFLSDTWSGQTFFLLTKDEWPAVDLPLLKTYLGEPDRELTHANYRVLVFSDNPAGILPEWDPGFDTAVHFPASKRSIKHIGQLVASPTGDGFELIAEKGETGYLHFGPYVSLAPGSYVVRFDVVAEYNRKGVVQVDVIGYPHQDVFAETTLTSSNQPQSLYFTLDTRRIMEFRVFALGHAQVIFRGVSVQAAAFRAACNCR